ncbi:hypothetical protein TIFTF001_004593 [Ficus carica]|uniref:Thioredoxin-like protein AAED1, chloroplastic n=1 Tax=Ficus carica TaxID=3494 RepID=A0AA88DD57_FICCA|nr:hypothetical protein TIFTF001_004593 [Ficus carica]
MALAVARALHAQSLPFPSSPSPSLLPYPSSRALPTPYAPSLFSPKPAARVVGLRRHVVARPVVSDFDPSIGDILGNVSIFTAAGEPVLFKDLWDQNEGIAVVALLRHFGCFCCWELASSIKEAKERFDSAGVKLVAVGVGTPDKARILADRLPFPMDCLYADPDRKGKVFSRFEAIQKAMENYTIKATPDDLSSVLQQGGMFVFKGKQLLYARKDEATGDHAPLDDIFNACCKVPVS